MAPPAVPPKKEKRPPRDARMQYVEEDEDRGPFGAEKQKLEHYAEDILAQLHRNDPRDPTSLSLLDIHFSRHFYRDFAFCFLHNNRIRKLQLERCNMGDVACERIGFMLRENSSVSILSLCENHIKSVGCGFIARLLDRGYGTDKLKCRLTHLFLNRNHIGPVGAKSLSLALVHNRTLEALEVRENCIDSWGVGWMCMGLKQNLTLRVLDLQSNPVGSNGKHELETLMNATGREIVVQDYNVPAPTSPTTEKGRTSLNSIVASRSASEPLLFSEEYLSVLPASKTLEAKKRGAALLKKQEEEDTNYDDDFDVPEDEEDLGVTGTTRKTASKGSSNDRGGRMSTTAPSSSSGGRTSGVTAGALLALEFGTDTASGSCSTLWMRSRPSTRPSSPRRGSTSRPTSAKSRSSRPTSAKTGSRPSSALRSSEKSFKFSSKALSNKSDGSKRTTVEKKLAGVYFPAPTKLKSRPQRPGTALPLMQRPKMTVFITKFDMLQDRYTQGPAESYRPTVEEIQQRGLTATSRSPSPDQGRIPVSLYKKKAPSTRTPSKEAKKLPATTKSHPPAYYAPLLAMKTRPPPGEVLLQNLSPEKEHALGFVDPATGILASAEPIPGMRARGSATETPEKMVQARRKLLSPTHRKAAEDYFKQKGHFRKSYRHKYSPEYDFMGSITHVDLFPEPPNVFAAGPGGGAKLLGLARQRQQAAAAQHPDGEGALMALTGSGGKTFGDGMLRGTTSDAVIQYMMTAGPNRHDSDVVPGAAVATSELDEEVERRNKKIREEKFQAEKRAELTRLIQEAHDKEDRKREEQERAEREKKAMLDEDVQHGEDHDRRRKEVSAARPASSSGVRAGSARGATTSARARTSARRQLEPDAAAGGGGRIVPVRAADHEEEDEASPEDSYDMDGDDFIQDDDEALDEEIDVERDHEERAAPSSSTTGSTAGAGGVGVGVVLGGGGGGSTARSSRASASPPGSRPSSGEGRKGVTGGRGRRGHHQDRSSRAGRGRSYTRNKRMIPVAGELEDLPVAGTDLSNTPFIDRVLSPSGSPTLPVGGGRVQSPFLVDRITPAGIVASVPNKTSGARKKTGEGAVSCDEFAQPVKWSAQSSRGKIQPKDAERKNKEGGAGSRNRRLGAGHRAGSRSALGAPTTTSSSPEDDKIRSEVQDMEVLYGGSNPPASAQAEVARPDEASIRITPAAPETEQLEPPTAETAPAAASAVYSLDSGREMPSSAREEAHDESTQVLVLAEGEGDGDVVSRVTSHVVEEKLGPDGTSAAPPPESVAERAVFQVVEDQQAVQDVLLSSKGARMEEEKDDERARAEVSAEPAAAAPDVEETRQAEGAPATTEESSAPYQSVASRRAEANKRKAMARTRRSATVMMPPEGVMIDKESAPLPAAAPRTDGVDIVKDLLGGEHVAAEEHAGIAAAAQEQEGQLEVEESTQAVPAVDEVAPAAPPAAEIAETRSRVPASVPVPLEQDHGEVEAALLSSASAEQPEGREETEYQDDGPILGEEEDGVVEVSPAEADDDINDEILGRAYVEDKEQPAATVAPVAEKEQQLQKSKAASGSEEEQQDATHAVNVEARTEPQTAPQEQKQEQEVLGTEQDDAPVEEAPQASPSPASCAMLDTARSSIDTETQERAEVEEERKRARAFKEELGFQSSEIEVITDDGSSLRHGGI